MKKFLERFPLWMALVIGALNVYSIYNHNKVLNYLIVDSQCQEVQLRIIMNVITGVDNERLDMSACSEREKLIKGSQESSDEG